MKKAKIIKNGNVNLKTVKLDKKVNKEIDWADVKAEFIREFYFCVSECELDPSPISIFEWFKKRLSK